MQFICYVYSWANDMLSKENLCTHITMIGKQVINLSDIQGDIWEELKGVKWKGEYVILFFYFKKEKILLKYNSFKKNRLKSFIFLI